MQYGFILPRGDVHTLAELAYEAEMAGWDGVFYWNGIYIKEAGPMYDPRIVLAAMAMRTEDREPLVLSSLPSRNYVLVFSRGHHALIRLSRTLKSLEMMGVAW